MTDITIPPEAVKAAARAMAVDNDTREDWWRFYEGRARAACLAMLKAWPDVAIKDYYEGFSDIPSHKEIILPLNAENTNDKV
jgi:hypothetical protein